MLKPRRRQKLAVELEVGADFQYVVHQAARWSPPNSTSRSGRHWYACGPTPR